MKRGFRSLALAAAVALALVAVPASAESEAEDSSTYLALGDSYAFGFNPLVSLQSNPANSPGYTDSVAATLELQLTNASCPGESSLSMITGTRPDNGCQNFRSAFPLHTSYSGSQLAFAVHYLQTHRHTHLVTLQIGGNDLLILVGTCHNDGACIAAGLPAVLATMSAHLATIYSAIRNTAHYHHALVAVPYFAFNYNDKTSVAIAGALDGAEAAVAAKFHARVADALGAFAAASMPSGVPCFAGLQVVLNAGPPPSCDIHPSAAGHAVYARAVLAALDEEDD
jgi:lysophospholipase L1-like esterase